MKIQEAIKSGQNFGRPHFNGFIKSTNFSLQYSVGGTVKYVTKVDLLADDWVIERPNIKKSRHGHGYCSCCHCHCCCSKSKDGPSYVVVPYQSDRKKKWYLL